MPGVQALMLTATRQSAYQSERTLTKLGSYMSKQFGSTLCIGGIAISDETEALNVSSVVLGTPGRVFGRNSTRGAEARLFIMLYDRRRGPDEPSLP